MENSSKTLIGGLSGAAILALLFAVPSTKPSAPVANRGAATTTAPKPKTRGTAGLDDSGPWAAVCQDYWVANDSAVGPVQMAADPPQAKPGATEFTSHDKQGDQKFSVLTFPSDPHLETCKSANDKVAVIVASAPDPLASHLQLDFDRSITAYQRAASVMGYNFQRYWFPWTTAGGSEDSNHGVEDDQMRLRLQQPGVLVFRKSAELPKDGAPQGQPPKASDERLLIFIVGETPTGGLNRRQFNNALLYAGQLRAKNDREVNIAGPQFSASLPAMADVLMAQPEARTATYRVYSPSASSDNMLQGFSSQLLQAGVQHDLVTFEATYQQSLKLLRDTLATYGYKSSDLAVLVEDESAFGSNVARTDRAANEEGEGATENDASQAESSETTSTADVSPSSGTEASQEGLLTLQFPRDLSAIRNAADMAPVPGDQSGVPSLGVPLSLRERTVGDQDSPPAYAREQSAAALDRELQSLVRTLRAHQTQVVILAVSNPLDRVYLFDYFHRALPDVRLATLDADVFTLGRPRYVDLRGTMGVTALPLTNTSEVSVRAAAPEQERRINVELNSTPQAGAYLSVLSLLSDPAMRPLKPYKANACAFITFVGKSGFEVAKLGYDQDSDLKNRGCKPRAGIARLRVGVPQVPWTWTTLSTLLLAVAGYYIYWCLRNSFTDEPDAATGLLPPLLVVRKESPHRLEKLTILLGISNQLLLMEWMVITASVSSGLLIASHLGINSLRDAIAHFGEFWGAFKTLQSLNLLLHGFVFAACVLISVRLAFRVCREYRGRKKRDASTKSWPKYFWSNLPISIFYVLLTGIVWWRVLGAQTWHTDPVVALRSINLTNGLSPLAMIASILLAYTLWGYSQLQRITMMESRQVLLKFREPEDKNDQKNESLDQFEDLHDRFHEEVDFAKKMKLHKYPLLVTVTACVLLRLNVALRGIDGSGLRDWSMFLGVGMLALLLSVSYQQMWAVWRSFRKILEFLDATPIRENFGRLPKEISSMRIWRIGLGHQSLAIQRRTLKELKAVVCPEVVLVKKKVVGLPDSQLEGTAIVSQYTGETDKQLDESIRILQRIEDGDCSVCEEEVEKVRTSLNLALPSTVPLLEQDAESPIATAPSGAYLTYRFLALIQYALLQIRTMVIFQVFGFACVVICIAMYPFQGRQSLSMLLTMLFFGLLGVLGFLFTQMDGDPILRRLETQQTGGKDKDEKETEGVSYMRVLGKVLTVGGVPMMAVLTSQFPSFAEFFSTWFRPAAEALK